MADKRVQPNAQSTFNKPPQFFGVSVLLNVCAMIADQPHESLWHPAVAVDWS